MIRVWCAKINSTMSTPLSLNVFEEKLCRKNTCCYSTKLQNCGIWATPSKTASVYQVDCYDTRRNFCIG